jgi:hypothetical protein
MRKFRVGASRYTVGSSSHIQYVSISLSEPFDSRPTSHRSFMNSMAETSPKYSNNQKIVMMTKLKRKELAQTVKDSGEMINAY